MTNHRPRITLSEILKMPDIVPHDGFEFRLGNDVDKRMSLCTTRLEIDEINLKGDRQIVATFVECADFKTQAYVMTRFAEETSAELEYYDLKGESVRRQTFRVMGVKATAVYDGGAKVCDAYRCVYKILSETALD